MGSLLLYKQGDQVTAHEMSGGDLYKGLTGDKFVVGQNKDDDTNSSNNCPNRWTNGPLCFATSYTFFVRAFLASGSNQVSLTRFCVCTCTFR